MAYVGTPIDTTNQFQSLQGKRFDGDGSTTDFTLDIAPSSVFDIEVFVENVRQDPNSAYTLSGTTLTFTGAPASGTNNIYVVHQAKAVGTIDVPDSYKSQAQTISGVRTHTGVVGIGAANSTSVPLRIFDAGSNTATTELLRLETGSSTDDSGIKVDFRTAHTNGIVEFLDGAGSFDGNFIFKLASGSALATPAEKMRIDSQGHVTIPNQPCVLVQPDAERTYDATNTKIILPTERFDVNGDYNNSTYVFTAPVTGKYMFSLSLVFAGMGDGYQALAVIASNRTYNPIKGFEGTTYEQFGYSVIIDMDANDTAQFNVDHQNDTSYNIREDSAVSIYLIG